MNQYSIKILPTHDYAKSAELKFLYTQLYPGQTSGFQGFIKETQSKAKLSIEDPAPSKQALSQEIDFPLRQFLWFIRPAPDLLAYEEFFHRWQLIYTRRHQLQVSHLIPWDQLHQIASDIRVHISQYMANCKTNDIQPTIFPKYSVSSTNKGKHLPNPMSRHSSVDFPLYTILLESPANKPSTTQLHQAFEDLIALTLVHEAQQLKVSEQEQHPIFLGPYDFLRKTKYHGPGHASLSETRRAIRKWADKLRYTSFEKQIAPGLTSDYKNFRNYCTALYAKVSSLPQDNPYIGEFLRYFAIDRQSRIGNGFGGAQSFKRKDGGTGGHYWVNFDTQITTEEISSHAAQISQGRHELTEDQFTEAQEAGEDPFEDSNELSQAEIIFLEDVPQSNLILNQHTSHSQQLMATINQRIWWSQTEFTHEDISQFMRFLESKSTNLAQGSAADVLKLMILLGVDLDMALQAHLIPQIDDIDWIKGKTKPPFGVDSLTDHILLTEAHIDPKDVSQNHNIYNDIWSYPIKTLSYLDKVNAGGSKIYEAHASRIAFRDESGFIKIIKHRWGNVTAPTPLFLISNHEQLRQDCQESLKEFNDHLNVYAHRPQERRLLSLQKIQGYYRTQLQRSQLDQSLVDTLDWNTPLNQIPTLHYCTHHLHRQARNKTPTEYQPVTGLQYALSTQTGLYTSNPTPYLPSTKNLSVGATDLVKVQTVKNGIAKILNLANKQLKAPGSKNYLEFIETINAYSTYVMLWFCMETSHRPHHIPYVSMHDVDPLHGIIKLKDKSTLAGEKYRLSWVSPELRQQMQHYAQMLNHLRIFIKRYAIELDDSYPCIFLSPADTPEKNSVHLSLKHGLHIEVLDATYFRQMMKQYFGRIAPNFYRKLMVHLFLENKSSHQISPEHIRHWLGHWTHGTAPSNEFKTTDHLAYIREIEKPLRKIIGELGFKLIQLKLPRLPSQSELKHIHEKQPKIKKTGKK